VKRALRIVPLLAILAAVAAACGGGGGSANNGNSGGAQAGGTTASTSQINTWLSQGLAAQNAGNYPTAIADYNQILAVQPANYLALYDLGLIEQLQNKITDAENHYRASLAVNPNFAPALFNLAILVTPSSPSQASALYQQVLSLQPNNASAHLNLGYVDLTLGSRAEAITQFRAAIRLDPTLAPRVPNSVATSVPGARGGTASSKSAGTS
jgi:tetratricopeptide (TPR) repeat protein